MLVGKFSVDVVPFLTVPGHVGLLLLSLLYSRCYSRSCAHLQLGLAPSPEVVLMKALFCATAENYKTQTLASLALLVLLLIRLPAYLSYVVVQQGHSLKTLGHRAPTANTGEGCLSCRIGSINKAQAWRKPIFLPNV